MFTRTQTRTFLWVALGASAALLMVAVVLFIQAGASPAARLGASETDRKLDPNPRVRFSVIARAVDPNPRVRFGVIARAVDPNPRVRFGVIAALPPQEPVAVAGATGRISPLRLKRG